MSKMKGERKMRTKSNHRWYAVLSRSLRVLAFIAAYVALDWASYLHPLYGLNITPWNPALGLGLVLWLRHGPVMALPWFVAILVGETVVRGLPADLVKTVLLSMALLAGYAAIGATLRRRLGGDELFGDRPRLFSWLLIVVAGTLATALLFITLLHAAGLIPAGDWAEALARFWVGDCVGVLVTMPFFWLLVSDSGQARLRQILCRWETAGYGLLAVAMLWVTFARGSAAEFQYFYFLFLPVVWAAARQGMAGAAVAAFALQAGVIVAVEWLNLVALTVLELQMLGAVLALVGFFIGVVVDEQRQAAERLRQSLHLVAAGEMAAALAHELNQPMTALAAYGSACEYLLAQGETGPRLAETIRRMVAESSRAADVVRRLRDFFRTGATRLEPVAIDALLAAAAAPFTRRAEEGRVAFAVAPAPAVTVLADRLQIEVALRNLIANAFDAVAEAGERRVAISTGHDGDGGIRITVEDSGPGITAAAEARLFEPFASTKSSGLGLGLVISRALVEAHGGRLWAEVGDHGIFRLSLPIQEAGHEAA